MKIEQEKFEKQAYLFNVGEYFKSYEFLGCHVVNDQINLFNFTVWAPNAKNVQVISSANDWKQPISMRKIGQTGIWTVETKEVHLGDLYKFQITDQQGNVFQKIDPYGFQFEKKPGNAAIVANNEQRKWHDRKWLKSRSEKQVLEEPLNIYELHAGSWRRHEDDSYYSYTELADELIPYVKKRGYTHIELLPIMEHLLDASWGYQQMGYFAPTSRFGNLNQFMEFVDRCHQANIGVIVDWVPGHFIKNYDSLYQFDGTPTFEYSERERAENKRWGSWNFDLGKNQVQSFLISSAMYWIDHCHLDGLRVDAVSNMLYLDYDEGKEGRTNYLGDNRNLEGISFLQKLNTVLFAEHPDILMIAEESSAFPKVTAPVSGGGLGFNLKWNMGWMNDTLKFFEMDPLFRKDNFKLLTFAFMYMYDEQFVLPFSHDEVVHGKKSLMHKMPGDRYNQFANLRTMLAYQTCFPGKKLNFMGSEWGQFLEWRDWSQLEWVDLKDDMNLKTQTFTTKLNELYRGNESLWQQDFSPNGMNFTNTDDAESSTMTFLRRSKKATDFMICAFNFVPVERQKYRIGVPYPGEYELLLNTEDVNYGGTWTKLERKFHTEKIPFTGQPYSFTATLPAMGALLIRPINLKEDINNER